MREVLQDFMDLETAGATDAEIEMTDNSPSRVWVSGVQKRARMESSQDDSDGPGPASGRINVYVTDEDTSVQGPLSRQVPPRSPFRLSEAPLPFNP